MSHSASRTLQFDMSEEALFQAFLSALPRVRVTRLETDKSTKTIEAETGVSWRSWGEQIHISIHKDASGQATATLRSSLKLGLVDWGKNNSNLDLLQKAVNQAVDDDRAAS